jgi:multimeric flavodoxin WrbA
MDMIEFGIVDILSLNGIVNSYYLYYTMIKLTDLLLEAQLPSSEQDMDFYAKKYKKTIDYLRQKNKILLLTTSNRWSQHKEDVPKSSQLAIKIQDLLGKEKVTLIDTTKLNIVPCEGNVSSNREFDGNHCGTVKALLKDKEKNPSGYHRCWASINEKNDELWKISKELFESDTVLFFASVRWGQANGYYQKLIERLTWIENRHSTLGEKNIVKNIDAGFIATGQNWNGKYVTKTQKEVLQFFGFNTPDELFWNWQFTDNTLDETNRSYNKAITTFDNTFLKPYDKAE